MVKFYNSYKKGMKKAKSGKYYYPKKKTNNYRKKYSHRKNYKAQAEIHHKEEAVNTTSDGEPSFTYLGVLTNGNITPKTSASAITNYVYVPDTWKKMTRGFNESEMSGRDIFAKNLCVKMLLNYSNMQEDPVELTFRILHGWLKVPPQYIPEEELTNPDYEQQVKNVVEDEFGIILKNPSNKRLKILSDRTFSVPMKTIETPDASSNASLIHRRERRFVFNWKFNRKLTYSRNRIITPGPGDDGYDSDLSEQAPTKSDTDFWIQTKGQLWVPFWLIWDKTELTGGQLGTNYASQGSATERPRFAMREDFYFTDS